MAQPVVRPGVYHLPSAGSQYLVFTMPFGKSTWTDTSGYYLMQNADIIGVDLVFTDYPANLDLKPLNRRRFEALHKLLPVLFQLSSQVFGIVRQMDGAQKETAENMLHGFVVHYRTKPSEEDAEREINIIKRSIPPPYWKPPSAKGDSDSGTVNNTKTPPKSGSTGKINYWNYKYRKPTLAPTPPDSELAKHPPYPYSPPVIRDSTVMNVLKRNPWKRMLLVADVTGSMSSWNAQVVQWITQWAEEDRIAWIAAFNDGDGMPDNKKQPGKTGGVYAEPFKDVYQAGSLLQLAMRKGGGGDHAENNCEALITAINMATGFDNVVMIADGWAPMRDISLLTAISKPIHIVLCGGPAGVLTDYMAIAMHTGGSLHFRHTDVTDFSPLRNGEPMTINGRMYQLMDGTLLMISTNNVKDKR